jgi:hypothetical protein
MISAGFSIHAQEYDRSDFEGKGGKGGKKRGKKRGKGGKKGKKGGKGGVDSASEDAHNDDGYERFDDDAGKGSGGNAIAGSGKGSDEIEDSVSQFQELILNFSSSLNRHVLLHIG